MTAKIRKLPDFIVKNQEKKESKTFPSSEIFVISDYTPLSIAIFNYEGHGTENKNLSFGRGYLAPRDTLTDLLQKLKSKKIFMCTREEFQKGTYSKVPYTITPAPVLREEKIHLFSPDQGEDTYHIDMEQVEAAEKKYILEINMLYDKEKALREEFNRDIALVKPSDPCYFKAKHYPQLFLIDEGGNADEYVRKVEDRTDIEGLFDSIVYGTPRTSPKVPRNVESHVGSLDIDIHSPELDTPRQQTQERPVD